MPHYDLPLEQLQEFRPAVREPEDFDQFWRDTLSEARRDSGQVQAVGSPYSLAHVDVADLTFPGFGGTPVKGWYSRPAGVTSDLPVVVQFVGYGGGRGLPLEHTVWPSAGFAHVVIDNRGQGGNWGSGGHTPDPGGSSAATSGYMTRGILDPHEHYYRRLYTDAVRAVDAVRELPGVDSSRIVVTGASQGGAMTLAVAGLVPHIAAVMPDVAFLCHIERGVSMVDTDPFAEVRRYLSVHRDQADQAFTTLSYIDGVNFAKRATVPALWSVALMDDVVPPSTTYAAFNHYGASRQDVHKEMAVYPFNGHQGGESHHMLRQLDFLAALLN